MKKAVEKQITKHAGGRPTKYVPSMIQSVEMYLKTATKENMHLPKVESLALYLGVNKTTLYEWAKKYPEFSNALEKVLLMQGERLIDDGIYGGKEVNSPIVKLLLENNHGMRGAPGTLIQNNFGDHAKKELEEFE